MKSNISLVCFSGVAKSGKDSAANILTRLLGIVVHRYAFADELKSALDPICKKYHGFSSRTTNPTEKEIIRPLMVSLGCTARQSNPRVWIDIIDGYLKQLSKENANFTCFITDVRFQNEATFIQKEWNGLLINVEKMCGTSGILLPPANMEEEINYPKVKARADINLVASNLIELEAEIVKKVMPKL